MTLYRTPEGLKSLPVNHIHALAGETFIIGQYARELAAELGLNKKHIIDHLPSMKQAKYNKRNLLVTDVSTANSIFWHKENSRIRNFASNAFLIPAQLNVIDTIWGPGFSEMEIGDDHYWKWCVGEKNSGILVIYNRSGQPRNVRISFKVQHNLENNQLIQLLINKRETLVINDNQQVDVEFILESGENKLEIIGQEGVNRLRTDDARLLNFRVIDFQISHDYSNFGAGDYKSRWQLHESGFESVQEIASTGVVSYSDGFQNEPRIYSIDSFPSMTNLAWYLAKAVKFEV